MGRTEDARLLVLRTWPWARALPPCRPWGRSGWRRKQRCGPGLTTSSPGPTTTREEVPGPHARTGRHPDRLGRSRPDMDVPGNGFAFDAPEAWHENTTSMYQLPGLPRALAVSEPLDDLSFAGLRPERSVTTPVLQAPRHLGRQPGRGRTPRLETTVSETGRAWQASRTNLSW